MSIKTSVVKVAHHPPQHVAQRYPYAAFGSNLLLSQIASRCKQCDIINRGELDGWRLDFARVATISQDDASSVPVGIYRLSPNDVHQLDTFEGHNRVYDRYLVTPRLANGELVRCFTYVKRESVLEPPMHHYFEKIKEGYKNWSLNPTPLFEARKRAEVAWEAGREERERKAKERGKQYDFDYTKWQPVSSYGAYYDDSVWRQPRKSRKERRRDKQGRFSNENVPLLTGPTTADYQRTALANMPVHVPRYLTAHHREVEWGARGGDMFFRVKGSRVWYRDCSSHEDIQSGLVRGEFEQTLPGAQAFKPVKGAE